MQYSTDSLVCYDQHARLVLAETNVIVGHNH